MRFIRKIYNMNKEHGVYPGISFPPELADQLTPFVFVEEVPEGILIRPMIMIPK